MAVLAALVCLACYAATYRFYAGYLSTRIFSLRADIETPAHQLRDEIDYVPAPRSVLFGHHFASITGLSPMLGPAIAVIWGWLPAMIWVVGGSLFIGCVHDMSALVLSVRARGLSVGAITEGIIGARAKTMFHVVIFFGVALAMGVFVSILCDLFMPGAYPQAVMPSAVIMALAVVTGVASYKRGVPMTRLATAAFGITLLAVFLAATNEWLSPQWDSRGGWGALLLAYAFGASVLPVWLLLQPRDFINSLLLYLGMGLMYGGFFVLAPEFSSPAVVLNPEGAPPMFPFVFVVIACGAVSGFHGLVASGTTAKQLDRETDARAIGYGGMMGESLLGLMAVLACTAGFSSAGSWHQHYSSWGAANTLGGKLGVFIEGGARFVSTLGLPSELSTALISVVVVSFALTTLDSATRLLRYNIAEMGQGLGVKSENRFVTSALAVLAIGFFAFYEVDGKPMGLTLWGLFGTTNQLLASLTLILVSLYLYQRGRNPLVAVVPAVFMTITTVVAMVNNLGRFYEAGQHLLLAVGLLLLLLALGIVGEGLQALRRATSARAAGPPLDRLSVF